MSDQYDILDKLIDRTDIDTSNAYSNEVPPNNGYATTVDYGANGYQSVDIGLELLETFGDKICILTGIDISGTGSSAIHILGFRVYKGQTRWLATIKTRNMGGTALSGITVTALVAWIGR